MKKLGKQKNKKRFILKILLGFIIGISFAFGMGNMIKRNSNLRDSIEKTLQQNCNCESVTLDDSAVGIQFNKVDGVSNSTFHFTTFTLVIYHFSCFLHFISDLLCFPYFIFMRSYVSLFPSMCFHFIVFP